MDPSSSSRVAKKYQVFLSFRGEDTRRTIVSHLHKALLDRGIDTFKDDKRIETGDSISDELKEAIKNSKIAVVVISENYASSTWCLNELQMIMELRKSQQLTVVPIFYDVTPSDVRHLKRTFSLERYTRTEVADKVLKWRQALTEIAGISGKVSNTCDNEAMMVDDVARRISRQLFSVEPIDLADLVGMNAHMERLSPLLKLKSTGEVRMIGIWGMGGVGKTTIAKYLYKKYSHQFAPHQCFIENIRSSLELGYNGLLQLQEKLLSRIVGEEYERVWAVEQGCSHIKSRLENRKVFLVLDDIDNLDQLNALAKESSWFGPGSRIIVTTRDKGLFCSSGVGILYHVDVLAKDDAIQVFKKFAFEGGEAPPKYNQLVVHASSLAQGLPSALQAFGEQLRRMASIEEWEKALRKLEKIPHKKIMEILRISYMGLDRIQKATFLHIACIFNGESVKRVKALLNDGELEIKCLAEKSLIDISADGCITMHGLVEQAGKEFVREESDYTPLKQKILWDAEHIIPVLRNNTETPSMESLSLHMCDMPQVMHMMGSVLDRSNLRFLKIFRHLNHMGTKLHFLPGTEGLPHNVLLLHWDGYPLHTLPPYGHLRNIVEINLRHSNLTYPWGGDLRLGALRRLDLTCSRYLTSLPDLSHATKLEELIMEGCTSLQQPRTIDSLHCLQKLNMSRCGGITNLEIDILEEIVPLVWGLREKIQIVMHLPSAINNARFRTVANLSIDGRIHIKLENLTGSADHISYISVQQIPDEVKLSRFYDVKSLYIKRARSENGEPFRCTSFSNFPWLAELKLINLNILSIPGDIVQLQSLEKLDLSGNDFTVLPSSMANLSKLRHVRLCNCSKLKELPELSQLLTLKLSGCSDLRSLLKLSITFYKRVRYGLLELGLDNCKRFKSLSYQVRQLTSLIHLDLSRHDFTAIPESIRGLRSLETLCLNHCKKLKSLEGLPESLKYLYAHGCYSLNHVDLPSNHSIEHLDLSYCFSMNQEHLFTQILSDRSIQAVTARLVCLPGRRVPSYFDNQSPETSISLPPNIINPKLVGVAVCILILLNVYPQFPKFTYSWIYEADRVIRIDLKPTDYYSREFEGEGSLMLHHMFIIYVPTNSSSINIEELEGLRVECHLQYPEGFVFRRGEIRGCGIRIIH